MYCDTVLGSWIKPNECCVALCGCPERALKATVDICSLPAGGIVCNMQHLFFELDLTAYFHVTVLKAV